MKLLYKLQKVIQLRGKDYYIFRQNWNVNCTNISAVWNYRTQPSHRFTLSRNAQITWKQTAIAHAVQMLNAPITNSPKIQIFGNIPIYVVGNVVLADFNDIERYLISCGKEKIELRVTAESEPFKQSWSANCAVKGVPKVFARTRSSREQINIKNALILKGNFNAHVADFINLQINKNANLSLKGNITIVEHIDLSKSLNTYEYMTLSEMENKLLYTL